MLALRHRGRRLAVSALYDGAFKMLIDTTKAGSASNTFVLPCSGSGYNAIVSWGDGTSQVLLAAAGNVSHVYPASGLYVVSIRERLGGGFPTIYFNNGGDKLKVLDLLQFGRNKWTSLAGSFHGCANMRISATDSDGALTSAVTSVASAFRDCTSLVDAPLLDLRSVTTMASFFNGCTALRRVPRYNADLVTTVASAWFNNIALKWFPPIDFPSCTDFTSAWYLAGLTSFPFINVSAGQNFSNAWRSTSLAGVDFPALDLHNITNGAYILGSVNFSKASYNSMLDQLAYGRGSIPAAAANSVNFYVGAHYDNSTGGYDGTAARLYLTGTKSWAIADGGTP